MNKGEQMRFREFAIDTAYRCGWTFVQTLLACMTFGQSILDIDWKSGLFIALGSVVYVLLKQMGVWCYAHIKEPDELPRQFTFNADSIDEMVEGRSNDQENDTAEKQ